MVDHMIGTWEGKKEKKKFQIRNKVKEGRSFGNALKWKERRTLGNRWSIFLACLLGILTIFTTRENIRNSSQ